MAIVSKKEAREMSQKDMEKRLNELRLEQAKSKAQISIGGSPENPGRIRELRRSIARMLTIKKEKGG